MYDCWNAGIQFDMSSQLFNTCVLNSIQQHSQFLGTVPHLGVWTIILLYHLVWDSRGPHTKWYICCSQAASP